MRSLSKLAKAGGVVLLACIAGAGYWWFFAGQPKCLEIEMTPEFQVLLKAQEKVNRARSRDAVAHSLQSQADLRVAEEEYERRKREVPPVKQKKADATSGTVKRASAESCRRPT